MTGIALIAEERARGQTAEGYDAAHDAQHKRGEIAAGAIAYATVALNQSITVNRLDTNLIRDLYWPFERSTWKPETRIRNLVKAGAMIAAEIDRIKAEDAGAK